MKSFGKITLIVLLSASVLLSGCGNSQKLTQSDPVKDITPAPKQSSDNTTVSPSGENSAVDTQAKIDYSKVKPNESGKVMVVMFHNFIESYKSGDKEYTTTFDDFRKLLTTLYDKGYRLINVNDYLNNNISVPAGYMPMMFTFDDGTSGQFNLVEEDGKLVVNKQSAVGIMEEFNKVHPDFGLKGTLYVNLGLKTFDGKGTVAERLKYLIDKGFEIGNHTMTHIKLNEVKSADVIQKEIGGNQKKMYELVPGYKMTSFALPFGLPSKELQRYVAKGEFEGVQYENLAIMEVGWDPTNSQLNKKYNPLSTHRVRASGIKPVDADLGWWLKNVSRSEQYISDGNPNTITIPKAKEAEIDKSKLNGKQLIVY